jgi:hypothetical protein
MQNRVVQKESIPQFLSGWWLTHPSEKYESQLGLLFPIYGKIKHVPNHQPVMKLIHIETM